MRVPLLLPLLAALTACNNDYQVVAEEGELLLSPAFHDLGLIAVGTTASAEVALLAPKGRVKVLAVEVQNMEGDAFTAEYGDLSEITDDAPVSWSSSTPPAPRATTGPG